jgi:hypothetical protein
MMSFGVFGNAVLLVLGGWWCWEMFRRGKRDLDEFRSSSDSSSRIAIAALWAATALILCFWCSSVVGILDGLGIV